jgi:exodeoxyribonuclease VII large subunit
VRDILRILRRRFPGLGIVLHPVRVQGEGAAEDIVEAIRFFNRTAMVDVMILARGGGSLEDLWAFNEESVARAIGASRIPIVSGVGHETDFTIADFVADLRAPTPSAAAEIVVRSRQEFERQIAQLDQQLVQRLRYLLLERRHRVRELASHRGFRRLEDLVRQRRQYLDELVGRLAEGLERWLGQARQRLTVAQTRILAFDLRSKITTLRLRLEQHTTHARVRLERLLVEKRRRLEALMLQLDERSPMRVLERGYAVCYDAAGRLVRTADQVGLGQEIAVQLARGRLIAEVKRKEPAK